MMMMIKLTFPVTQIRSRACPHIVHSYSTSAKSPCAFMTTRRLRVDIIYLAQQWTSHPAAVPIVPLSIILLVHIFISEDVLLKLLLALPKCSVTGTGGTRSVRVNRHLTLFRSRLLLAAEDAWDIMQQMHAQLCNISTCFRLVLLCFLWFSKTSARTPPPASDLNLRAER